MRNLPVTLILRSADETARLARRIGALLNPGDCLLLSGQIGAGKTHFARHLIQSLLRVPEDVPSPTFTLVQTYATVAGALWHADLYRLNSLDEVEELGLSDAFEQAICLVEWPDRLGAIAPPDALQIAFAADADLAQTRHITLAGAHPKWLPLLQGASNG
jgi:tRNA threonylcarbamoyladenosine biosynthesis protein TsaE